VIIYIKERKKRKSCVEDGIRGVNTARQAWHRD